MHLLLIKVCQTGDISNVTNMWNVFKYASSFNGDISSWDVSNVISLARMFSDASSFNQDISSWDVSNVTTMYEMFNGASGFNQDISGWDVSNVFAMDNMFLGANALSDYNKCAIHTSFSSNDNWPYDWSNYCVFTPFIEEELQTAVDLWVDDNISALETYGEINTWDVSFITDMSGLFMIKHHLIVT